MKRSVTPFGACLLLALAAAPAWAGEREMRTVESAAEVVRDLSDIPLRGIPHQLLRDAAGVAVIPNMVKAGLGLGGRFGRGVVLPRLPDGRWGEPAFITLAGGGVGWQIGVSSTDVLLVFKTRKSLDRILRGKGKLTLGGDVSVAAGPVGREAQVATDGVLQAEIYSYSRSRGLFAGASLEAAGLFVDHDANTIFSALCNGQPTEVLAQRGVPFAVAVVNLKGELGRLGAPPVMAAVYPAPGPVIVTPVPAPVAPQPQTQPTPPPALPPVPQPVPLPPPGQ
jgi:lipid-binding SYLF domain-containing protein